MSDDQTIPGANCSIAFRVFDDARYEIFLRFFAALQQWSQRPGREPTESGDTTARRVPASPTADTQEATAITTEQVRQRSAMGKPEQWLLTLRPQDLEALGMPSHADAIMALRTWSTISRRERRQEINLAATHNQLQALADFADMLGYWQEAEIILTGCVREGRDLARISYASAGYPYHGKTALEEMLMFFGFFSIVDDSC